MNKIEGICTNCGKVIPPMIDANPTEYRKGIGDKIVERICAECYEKGIRFKND